MKNSEWKTFRIYITEHNYQVLKAMALLENSSMGSLVAEAVKIFAEENFNDDKRIAAMLNAATMPEATQ